MSKVLLQVNSKAGQDFKSELYGYKRADEIRSFFCENQYDFAREKCIFRDRPKC